MYISCGKIVPKAEAINVIAIKETPTFTDEKKFHILSIIDFLYVNVRHAVPSYLIFNIFLLLFPSTCRFSSIGIPQDSLMIVRSGLTCLHSHLSFFIFNSLTVIGLLYHLGCLSLK